ncbi:MAG: serine/threonine protein kinase [Muribaculaceae bacterium]|nr:serine/threonine protein kinase [Muribaculaceae bacterium]
MKGYTNVLAPGTIIKGKNYRYEIIKVLGQGSFGITYLASLQIIGELGSINANAKVAIKEFFMSDVNGRSENTVTSSSKAGLFDKYREKFVKEALNLSKLNHPNIVKVLECFEANNTVYYSMDYIEGENLDDYIRQRMYLAESETLRLSDRILDALGHMHSKGMLHLDLKPSNIMMRQGEPILIDFGLSKQYDEAGNPETTTSIGAGTPGYSPIEQSNYYGAGSQSKAMSATMDIYALGATMFKMLAGHRPPIASEILNSGFPEDELMAKNVSPKTGSLVKRLMDPLWRHRPQSVEEVKNEFRVPPEFPKKDAKTEEVKTVFDPRISGPKPPVAGAEVVRPPKVNTAGHRSVAQEVVNPFAGKQVKAYQEPDLKERHGCISAWLWVALVANAFLVLLYGIAMFGVDTRDDALGFGLCSVGAMVNVLSAILLLRWNKPGFYMMAVCSIMAIAINIFVLNMAAYVMIGSLFAVVVWWAILQIKKNGVSAWSQLSNGWGGKKNQTLFWIFGGIIALLFVLTLVAFKNAGNSEADIDWDEEIAEVVEVEDESVADKNLRFLKSVIVEANKQFPQKADEGLTITKVFLEGDYIVYIAECDEDVLDMDLLEENKREIKDVIKENLSSSADSDVRMLRNTCIKANKGIAYKYVGDTSGKSFTVRIPVSELEKM